VGTAQTLEAMKTLVQRARADDAFNRFVLGVVQTPERIDGFLRAAWDVVPDPEDAEFVRSVANQLRLYAGGRRFMGDCDDAAVLSAAMLAAFDVPCWFVAIRQYNAPEFSHVFTRAAGLPDIDVTTPLSQLPIVSYAEAMTVPAWE
jgi:hypothetical protein